MSEPTRKERIEQMLALDPDDSFLRYGLAMEHVSAGNDDLAVREFAELSRRDPKYVPAYLQVGQALVRLGRDDEARELLRQGIRVAGAVGDEHAAGEMNGLLASLG